MPRQILDTYLQYIDNFDMRFQIGKTFGESIETNYLFLKLVFSMNIVVLLMRPWIRRMKESGIEPRTFADDLFFYSSLENHEQ